MPTETEDMNLIVASCDAYIASNGEASPVDGFFDALHRHDAMLRRTARYLNQPGADEPLMPPHTLRVCASYLREN